MVREAARYLGERWRDERSASSVAFDDALGVQTAKWTLGGYEPTPPEAFADLMSAMPGAPDGATFIDVGAGKGRVLLLAARHPFGRVLGLELDAKLVAIAQRNLRQASDPDRLVEDVSMLHADATTASWPLGPLVVFLYNPFAGPVLAQMLDQLEASLQAHPRSCRLVYLNPMFVDVLVDRGWSVVADGGEGVDRWVWLVPLRDARG
jgi:predicted RNA methylase